jgi:hypothetical protein
VAVTGSTLGSVYVAAGTTALGALGTASSWQNYDTVVLSGGNNVCTLA